MLSAVGGLWTLLSLIVAGLSTFSFLQPYWYIHQRTLQSLGMYSFCLQDDLASKIPEGYQAGPFTQACGLFGDYFDFGSLPSDAWQVSCVMYGGGCVVLVICAMISVLVLCLPSSCDTRTAVLTGYVQTTAVVLLTAGLVIFPVGLESSVVQHYCPEASVYRPGTSCQIGWAYLLGIVATALAFFAPFLAQYTDISLDQRRLHSSPNKSSRVVV
ncbi:hypothetical protein CAPTEDRAFT_148433 [Capitella teleta]|uniref:Uncharacterized protein n=1 Tax=Capitella teleta TaxID=283909 RepID=R7TNS5_CAPTE|nr:hypothetical protein CAPTEDRAFT_148433 [Capitella teleta]|eukprot:ELT95528.1 hypothetical protein CAPTEDRAFT_148433 [Capitella teleta]